MNRLIYAIATVIFLLHPWFVDAVSHQSEIIQRVDSDIRVVNSLLKEVEDLQNNPEEALTVLLRDIPKVRQHLIESSNYYKSNASSESDENLKIILIKIDSDVNGLSNSLSLIEESIAKKDETSYLNSWKQYDGYIDSLNKHIKELNSNLGFIDYSWLIWPFLISLFISTLLFIMSRGNPILPAEQLRNQFEFALFKSSLWPTIGSAITYFWYILTPPGGTFTILYGLIIIGYFQFFRGLYIYITQARPAINLAKKEEKEKLELLIKSERLQNESMQDKIKDIEKKTGVIDLSNDQQKNKDKSEIDRDNNSLRHCKNCNTKNDRLANFCRICGNKL